MEVIEFATLLWATAWAFRAASRLYRGDRNSLMIVYLIFFGEYAFPLGLDGFMGLPGYAEAPGFDISSRHPYVRVLYCIFLIIVPLIWIWKAKVHSKSVRMRSPRWAIMMLRVGSLLPLYFVFVAPEPAIYLQYAGVITANAGLDVAMFHIVVSMATMVAVLCVAGRCLIGPLSYRTILEVVIATALSIWINGKRYIVANALIFVILALWYRGAIQGKRLIWTTLTGAILLGAFSVSYQANIRSISFDPMSQDDAQENMRVDYTRDSRVRMALFSTLYPDKMHILDYAGQNLAYYATFWVPRSMWAGKPHPYAYYFTSAMLNRYPQDLGWGMTTGIFDETIANLGLVGILIGPLLIRLFCTLGDSTDGWSVHILTCVIACLLLSVQLAAFVPFVLIWVVIVTRRKHIPFWRPVASSICRKVVTP